MDYLSDTELGKELFCMAFDLPDEKRRLVLEAVRRLIGKEWDGGKPMPLLR